MKNELIADIANAWRNARTVVVFTGAGMSTESGLPDFRSAQGMWKQRPESLATLNALSQTPADFYFFYQWRILKLGQVSPNAGHLALTLLEKTGQVHHVITQNVDGLHQLAGSEQVSELHGTLKSIRCQQCGSSFASRELLPTREGWEAEYQRGDYQIGPECFCRKCGGNLRPDVVLFGEALPNEAWRQSKEWSSKADLFVVIGSSLVVSPANLLPQTAVQAGAKLLIINQEPTPLDHMATWRLRDKAAESLRAIVEKLNNS
jgi:NAD-dependent deacetylase